MRTCLGITRVRPGVVRGSVRFDLGDRVIEPFAGVDEATKGGARERDALRRLELQRDGRHPLPARWYRRMSRQQKDLYGGHLGYVFQDPAGALDPFRRVGRQLEMAIARAHPEADRAALRSRAEEWLRKVQLPDVERVLALYPHEISGGMAQRVGIATTLATEPRLLVADEPTTGLDSTIRKEVVELIARLTRSEGLTTVLISHDYHVVQALADRVAVLYRGELMEVGTRAQLLDQPPSHPYTSDLREKVDALAKGRRDRYEMDDSPPEPGLHCRFVHRCPRARTDEALDARCRAGTPELVTLSPGHLSRCVLAQQNPAAAS